jgi:hypothetical protein
MRKMFVLIAIMCVSFISEAQQPVQFNGQSNVDWVTPTTNTFTPVNISVWTPQVNLNVISSMPVYNLPVWPVNIINTNNVPNSSTQGVYQYINNYQFPLQNEKLPVAYETATLKR